MKRRSFLSAMLVSVALTSSTLRLSQAQSSIDVRNAANSIRRYNDALDLTTDAGVKTAHALREYLDGLKAF